ncbi:MAG: hypothetical protein HY724_09805 [Candidatus Rokubacteria bacterium]|nr:hypothetical protein [Candidatus Rokubacteria bacterium]
MSSRQTEIVRAKEELLYPVVKHPITRVYRQLEKIASNPSGSVWSRRD